MLPRIIICLEVLFYKNLTRHPSPSPQVRRPGERRGRRDPAVPAGALRASDRHSASAMEPDRGLGSHRHETEGPGTS